MKKNVMSALNTIACNADAIEFLKSMFPELDIVTTMTEVKAEYAKNAAKSEANAKTYAAAKEPVFAVMSSIPMTVKEIFAAAEDELPEGFTPNKVQWALLNLWNGEVVITENGKNPKTYSLK